MMIKNSTGFTLIELLITMAIVSILMSVGLPSFQSIITDTRLTSTANAMLSAYQLAKFEAIKQHKDVYVIDATVVDAANPTITKWQTWKVKYMTTAIPAIPADNTTTPPTPEVPAVPSKEKIVATFQSSKNIIIDATSIDFGGYDASGRPIDSAGHHFSAGSCEENSPCGITFKSSNTSDTNQRTLKLVMSGRLKITNP
jgi:prepilin-type N-terminal cleavage/methylation domain-containing protein